MLREVHEQTKHFCELLGVDLLRLVGLICNLPHRPQYVPKEPESEKVIIKEKNDEELDLDHLLEEAKEEEANSWGKPSEDVQDINDMMRIEEDDLPFLKKGS